MTPLIAADLNSLPAMTRSLRLGKTRGNQPKSTRPVQEAFEGALPMRHRGDFIDEQPLNRSVEVEHGDELDDTILEIVIVGNVIAVEKVRRTATVFLERLLELDF